MTLNFTAVMRLEAAQAKADAEAMARGIKGVTTATGELSTKSRAAAGAADAEAAAKRRNAQASQALATANRGAAGATGNLVAQFNDIGMMMAAGQNPLQLAIQQGSQITQVIGPMGAAGAARALGTAFMGMLNPISLITMGTIAAGAATVQWLTSASEEAKTAEDRVKALADATEAYRSAAEASGASVDSLRDKYGSLAMVAALALREDADRKEAANLAALEDQVDSLANTFGSLHQESRTVLGFTAEIIPAFERLQNRFNFTEAAASQFLGKLRELETAQGPVATANAAREIREWLEAAYGSAAKLPPEMAALYNELNSSTISAAELQGTLDLVAGTAQKVDAMAAAVNRTLASADGSNLVAAFSAAFPVASQLLGMAQGIISTIGAAQQAAAAMQSAETSGLAAQYAQYGAGRVAGERLARESGPLYGGRRVIPLPRLPGGGGGGGGGGAAARDEADALQELIDGLNGEIEALRVTDPIQQEMLKHREALKGATEAERQKVEELITTRERERAAMEAATQAQQFLESTIDNSLEALIMKGESLENVLKGVLASLLKAVAQSALLGTGPLSGLFGGKGVGSVLGELFGFADGGEVRGPGTGTSDSIPALLSNGEYVVNAQATAKNRHLLEAINAGGRIAAFAAGGPVGADTRRMSARGEGGSSPTFNISLAGARGDREIEEAAHRGMKRALQEYDRDSLPGSVKRISGDQRRVG